MLRFCCLSCTSYLYFHFSLLVKKCLRVRWFSKSVLCSGFKFLLKALCFWFSMLPLFWTSKGLSLQFAIAPMSVVKLWTVRKKTCEKWHYLQREELGEPCPIPTSRGRILLPRRSLWWAGCWGQPEVSCPVLYWDMERWTGAGGLAAFSFLVVPFQRSKLSVPAPAEFSCWPSPVEHKHTNVNPELALLPLPISSLLCFQVKLFFFFAHLCMSVHNAACFCTVKQGTSLPLLLHSKDFICMWCLMNLIS